MNRRAIENFLLIIAALGLLARIVVAAMSVGSYDAVLWKQFATQMGEHGLLELYRANPHFNHPPLARWWAAISATIANATNARFEFIFKLPMLASDVIVSILLWKIWSKRKSTVFAAAIVAAYAWNLDALLLGAYHCNIDSIYAMFALLAVYLVEERGAHLLGGLALGAAINVKLIPVVLIIPMLGAYRDPRLAARFLAGLFIGAIPFLVPILGVGCAFAEHVLGYTSMPTYWGINAFLRELVRIPRFSGWAEPIMVRFHETGRWIVLLTILLITLILRRKPNVDRYTTCAISAAIFLILAPGFGAQYSVFPIPLMMAAAPFFGTLYGTIAGIGALFLYWLGWSGTIPFDSSIGVPDDAGPTVQFGLIAWATLIAFAWISLRRNDEHGKTTISGARLLIAAAACGFFAREVLAWISYGSADIGIMQYIARSIHDEGLLGLYRRDAGHNHTPLASLACVVVRWISDATRLPFPFVFKQPLIISDAIVCVLLWKIWLQRTGNRLRAAMVVAAYAWCPIAILLSAHHGNFDPIYAMLCLLAAYTIDRHRAWFLGGLILGAAINVKLIPVLLVPVLAAVCTNRKELARFIGGLSIMSIPFLVMLLLERSVFVRNVIQYQSFMDYWGVNEFLKEASRQPRFSAVAQSMMNEYFDRGRWIVLGAIALLTITVRRSRMNVITASACAAAIFLIFTPGFGLQYLAFAAPLLFAASLTHGVVYGFTAGLFALFNYWLNWSGGLPIDSTGIATPPRAPGPQFGLLAWAVLVAFVFQRVRRRKSEP